MLFVFEYLPFLSRNPSVIEVLRVTNHKQCQYEAVSLTVSTLTIGRQKGSGSSQQQPELRISDHYANPERFYESQIPS